MVSFQKENILYELFIYAEWRPDPDFIRGEIARENKTPLLEGLVTILKSETLLENVSSFVNQLQPWQICLGDDGKVVAILQDSVVEIRTKRGNFSTIVARAGVPRDPHPQWRKMVWTPDCSILAISQSNGSVSFYDLMATNLFTIQSDHIQQPEILYMDNTYAISGIIFLTSRVDHKGIKQKWSSEVLLVDYKGCLRSYFVSPTDGFTANHVFNFEGGVSTITYHPSHNLLFVTGLPSNQKDSNKPSYYGLKGWRLLNDSPFYKLSISLESEMQNTIITSLLSSAIFPKWKKNNQSIITRAVASPNGSLLACLHLNGSVSLWNLPTLRLSKIWPLTSQPGFDVKSPLVPVGKHKVWPTFGNENAEFTPIDLNWWSNEALIISRLNGSVSVCCISDLHNMLGDNPEFLQGHPQVSSTFDNGFLTFECEAMLVSAKKLRRDSDTSEIPTIPDKIEDTGESSDEEKVSYYDRSTEVIKTALYIITDMERFQPKPKKLHLLSRVYRLLCLRSTTPEDLYARKIENADFVEALNLAQVYNLDSDLVYQQQWRTSPVSHQSIKDYLSKVSKKMWVIQQCCDRVPEALAAAKELIEFGLQISNAEMLKGVKNKSSDILNKLTVSDLTVQQSEILRYRHTMLFYLDRLEIYKAIIKCEFSTYSSEEYDKLRVNTITKSAIDLARNGRIQALKCLWPHINQLCQQLLVLQNLPETLNPNEYKILLHSFQTKQIQNHLKAAERDKDWCENEIFRDIWDCNVWNDDLGLDAPDITPPSTDLTEWYSNRAREIEKFSGLSCNALKLILLAQEDNISGLDALKNLLITLNTLVYDVGIHDMTLDCLQGCSPFQVTKYLMSQATECTVINDVKNILFPYLMRCQSDAHTSTSNLKHTLFKEYVINIAKEDLSLPIVILEQSDDLSLNTKTCLDLVEGCFLAQDSLGQLSLCFQLLNTLDKERDNSVAPSYFVKAFDEMKRNLEACSLLEMHNVSILYSDLKKISNNPKEAIKVLEKVAKDTSHSTTAVSAEAWNKLLTHILELQSKVFCCLDVEFCYEIYASSLLSSSNKISIQSARHVLSCHPNKEPSPPAESFPLEKTLSTHKISAAQKVPYNRSVSLVLNAAVNYFNSASSISSPSLDYAWVCLQLIKFENFDIENERDLLLALKTIEEFDLTVLPIQVRLYTPKLGLIEECLNCNNKAYKSVDKLIYLAKLLRISSENEKQREIIIVSICAEKAADNEDYEMCRSLCLRLLTVCADIGPGTDKAERAARRLGGEPLLNDAVLRRDLLNLALVYCDPQYIENLIQTRSHVEAEMLKTEMNNLVNLTCKLNIKQVNLQDSVESTDDDYMDALTSPQNENKSILSATHVLEKYVHKPLMNLSDKASWKQVLNISWLNERSEPEEEDIRPVIGDSKIICPCFYSSLHKDCRISNIFTQYDKFSTPDILDKQLMLLQALMRNNLLQDTVNYGCSDIHPDDVLMQCAEQVLYEETTLFISQLLSISDHSIFDKMFHKVFLDAKTITSVTYFYALLNYTETNHLPDVAFFLPPAKLLFDVVSNIQNSKVALSPSAEALINCKNRYIELLEGEKLNLMGCDVDIKQFIDDATYRKDVIVNLSKTVSKEKYAMAMELAVKYNIDEIEVAIAHLLHVLLNYHEIGFTESTNLTSQLPLIETLKKNASLVVERLINEVWNNLSGTDIQHLILFFNVITKIDDNFTFAGLSVKEHIKLIKKVKSACSNINYKYLLESPKCEELVEHILPYLTNENVGLITKLLRNLPQCLAVTFDSSVLYYRWLLKFFFNIPENLQSSKKWMQQYRECSVFFNKLKKEDLISFIEYILFSSKAIDILPAKTRIQIAYQTAELCHEYSNEDIKADTTKTWSDIGEDMTRWGKFLENLYSDDVQNVFKKLNINKEIYRCFENSQGLIQDLLQSLQTLIRCYEISFEEFKLLVETLSNDALSFNNVLLDILDQENLDKSAISNIINIVTKAKLNNIEVNQEIMSKIKPYTTSSVLSSKEKLEIMSLFKSNNCYNEDEDMLVQITKEMIYSTWNREEFNNLDDESILHEEKRDSILIQLIDMSDSWNKLHVAVDLINMWITKTTLQEKNTNPYTHLVKVLLKNDAAIENNIPLLKILIERNNISETDVTKIVTGDNSCHVIGKIWLCLLSNHPSILKNVLPSVIAQENDILRYEEYFDDNLISIILNKRLLIPLVNTVLYPKCVQYLLRNDCSQGDGAYTLAEAISDLLQNNFIAEAGTLKLAMMNIPHTLRNFTQAIKFMMPSKP